MRFLSIAFAVIVFSIPTSVFALPLGFGGIVTTPPLPCAPGFLFGFAGFLNSVPYVGPVIWIPGTKPNLVDLGAKPPVPTQCLIGSYVFGGCALAGIVPVAAPIITPIPGYGSSIPGCLFKKAL